VWRRADDGRVEIVLVHRPKYDDWSLPKGKLDDGEGHLDAALREVEEETGLRCQAGAELPSTHYIDNGGRSKVVRYWLMTAAGGRFRATDEVDELAWLPVELADRRLSYHHDRDVVRAATALIG
jgi:8-oxo-dGTP diphosphatase